jgi:thioredoxin-like negative regulator of GroEL
MVVQEPEPKKPASGVVATVAEVPPKRDPTAEDVLKLQKEIVARRPASDDEKLRLALLQASVGSVEEAERVLSTLKLRSNRMLPYVELYVRRQLGDHQEAGALLARLQEDERAVAGFGIERAELVTRVRRYRDSVPA